MERILLAALEGAYLTMLRMPHGSLRIESQAALCDARDAIAAAKGWDSREVQETFESRALAMNDK